MKYILFSADETLELGEMPRDGTVSVVVTGGFGGGTVTLGTFDNVGSFADFTDPAPFTAKGNANVFLGKGTTLVVDVSGSTTPDLQVGIASEIFKFNTAIYER